MSEPLDAPLTLAKADCLLHAVHRPGIKRADGKFSVERHHIHPLEYDGPDTADNTVYVCPTGHTAIHELLRAEVKSGGKAPWSIRRFYSVAEREYALEGYNRIVAAGKLPSVRRALGMPE